MHGTKLTLTLVLVSVAGLGIGVLIGYFSNNSSANDNSGREDETISKKLMNELKAENIKEHLRYSTLWSLIFLLFVKGNALAVVNENDKENMK